MKNIIIFVVVLLCCDPEANGYSSGFKYFSIASGGANGLYFPASNHMCIMINKGSRYHGYKCVAERTSGSIQNLNQIRNRTSDMAIVQSDWYFHAYNGSSYFKGNNQIKELRHVLSLHGEDFAVVARADTGIKTFDDLNNPNLKVAVGYPTSGIRATLDVLLKSKGWLNNPENNGKRYPFKEYDTATNKLIEQLCNGTVDVIMYAAGNPNYIIQQTTRRCNGKIIPIANSDIEKLIKEHPYYYKTSIPGGMYEGNPKDVNTFGVKAVLVAPESLDNDIVYNFVKVMDRLFYDFQVVHSVFRNLKKSYVFNQDNIVPLHPGAKKYYDEMKKLKSGMR